jgi:hypothetical protein
MRFCLLAPAGSKSKSVPKATLNLCFFAHPRIRSHAPTIPFVFSAFAGESGSSPGSNGCVLNQAPFPPMSLMVASSARRPCSMDYTPASSARRIARGE